MVDVILAAGFSSLLDGFLRLALAADEEDFFAFAGEVGQEFGRFVNLAHGFLDVEDVDLVAGIQDEWLHLWVPTLGLVTEVDSGFDEFGEDLI
jgi:hypothetical protein